MIKSIVNGNYMKAFECNEREVVIDPKHFSLGARRKLAIKRQRNDIAEGLIGSVVLFIATGLVND